MSLVWFVAIIVLIPLALLLLKRSGMAPGSAAGAPAGAPRVVASLQVGAQQRVVTIEVGEGAARRWVVLGVSAQGITALHTLEEPPTWAAGKGAEVLPFSQVFGRVLGRGRDVA
jgi:flagellar protein FliO/FliZ